MQKQFFSGKKKRLYLSSQVSNKFSVSLVILSRNYEMELIQIELTTFHEISKSVNFAERIRSFLCTFGGFTSFANQTTVGKYNFKGTDICY